MEKTTKSKGLELIELNRDQNVALHSLTPKEFIRSRPAPGGGRVNYVDGAYIIAKLNQAFGSLNWGFNILAEEVTPTEVIVHGVLYVVDHHRNFRIEKEQYGQADRHDKRGVPLGDAKKAAATDCLKKCAAYGFGIALDVYWPDGGVYGVKNGSTSDANLKKVSKVAQASEMFAQAKTMIMAEADAQTLTLWRVKINGSKVYTAEQKAQLTKIIDEKVKVKQN